MTPPMLVSALTLAANGWELLALNGKAPRTLNGVNDATADPDVLRRWWAAWPHANVGARVPRGVVVVDIDPQNGGPGALGALERAHGPLPQTLTVWSGRGDGSRHLYFRRPNGQLVGKLGQGIDVKRDNSYLVMPPSRHPVTGDPYRWERHTVADPPEWLRRMLLVPQVQPREKFAPVLPGAGEPLVRYVTRLPEGNRNAGLFWAACRAVEQGLGDDVLNRLVEAAVFIGLPELEARRTVQSAGRRTRVAA
jgi:hypothetical protein